MERYYNIAGASICIRGKDDEMYTDEYRLEPFRTEKRDADYQYIFSIEDELKAGNGTCIYESASRKIYQDNDKRIQFIGVVNESIDGAYIRCESLENTTYVQIKRKELPERITSKVVLNSIGIESLI